MKADAQPPAPRRTPRFSTTKFAPPEPWSELLRPRLTERLDRIREVGLGLVVGSAGAGKTSLLRQWSIGQPIAGTCWISIDEYDRDPRRFWAAVVHAVRSIRPDFGEEALGLMTSEAEHGPDTFETLVDDLSLVDPPVTLILDDFHRAEGLLDAELRRLIERRPQALCLMIGTRTEPRIGLGRLRADEALVEVRDDDLLLHRPEAERLLAGLDLEIDDEVLDVLMEQTEGWVAGVHMAGVAMRGVDDQVEFVRRLASSNDAIAHYLSNEIVRAQPPDVQRFMLDTCVVDAITPELAATLSPGTPVSLHDIESANLMLLRNSADTDSYHFHHLLARLMRAQLRAGNPDREQALHRRAAKWFAAEGDIAHGFRHLWRAGDHADAIRLLDRHLVDHYITAGAPDVSHHEFTITDADLMAGPAQATALAVALCMHRQSDAAERLAARIDRLAGDHLSATDRCQLSSLRAMIAAGRCDMEATVAHFVRASDAAEPDQAERTWFPLAATMAVRAHAWGANWQAAEHLAHDARADAGEFAAMELAGGLATLEIFRGNLGAGMQHAQRARDLAAEIGLQRDSAGSVALALLACGHLERADLSMAESFLSHLDERGFHARLPARIIADIASSRIKHARGDVDGAFERLHVARERVGHLGASSWVVARIDAAAARQLLAAGDLEGAAKRIEPLPDRATRTVLECRLLLALGDVTGAETLLERATGQADCVRDDVDVALARLQFALTTGQATGALADHVLSVAARERFVFCVAEAGSGVFAAVRERARQSTRTEFVDALLRAAPHAVVPATDQLVVDALTERELAVLRYLATSMSYREIAAELYISVNTLKSHVKHVFSKMNAGSRDEALARARDRGYL